MSTWSSQRDLQLVTQESIQITLGDDSQCTVIQVHTKGTGDYGITYAPDPNSNELFSTFSDADHSGCKDTGRSTGGYCWLLLTEHVTEVIEVSLKYVIEVCH